MEIVYYVKLNVSWLENNSIRNDDDDDDDNNNNNT